ncbi:MAG TPA: hypothetical protein VFC46_04050, partial [Humisphaera sp.]|nr:hypothetical protein [Humisphaera sp.]
MLFESLHRRPRERRNRLIEFATAMLTVCATLACSACAGNKTGPALNSEIRDAVAQIVIEADAGKDVGAYVTSTADLGIDAAIECARHIDAGHDARNAALLEVISLAGQSRRSNGELLKLYDPSAYRLYYLESGIADQQLLGQALALTTWPSKLPDAMVRAAPKATLAWMKQQATQNHPRIRELILIWQTWGFWARVGHERQYKPDLDEAASELNASAAIHNDPLALPALLRFAGEVHSKRMETAVLNCMIGFTPAVRAEAASACGRLASEACADAIIKAARREGDPTVQ